MASRTSTPLFVVVEGLDGTGKSTVAAELASRLDATLLATPQQELQSLRGLADQTFGPGSISRTLFYAATVLAASQMARAEIQAGRPVVMDRYWLTTMAYARVQGRDVSLPQVEAQLLPPDVTVYLTAPPSVRRERLTDRGTLSDHDRFSCRDREGEALNAAYLELSCSPLAGRFVQVDATGEVEQVVTAALAEVRR